MKFQRYLLCKPGMVDYKAVNVFFTELNSTLTMLSAMVTVSGCIRELRKGVSQVVPF